MCVLKRRPQEHTIFYSITDEKRKKNGGYDHYKVHQEPITCFYNQKEKKKPRLKKELLLPFGAPIDHSQDRHSQQSIEAKIHKTRAKEIKNREKKTPRQIESCTFVVSINNNNRKTKEIFFEIPMFEGKKNSLEVSFSPQAIII